MIYRAIISLQAFSAICFTLRSYYDPVEIIMRVHTTQAWLSLLDHWPDFNTVQIDLYKPMNKETATKTE